MAGSAKRKGIPPAPENSAPSGLQAVRITAFDAVCRTARFTLGDAEVEAVLDETLSPRVLETALVRGERVIAQREGGTWVVLGALRTAPTPGVDEGDDVVIKAKRLRIQTENEVSLTSGATTLVLRAQGLIETLAQDITTRATGIHKLVGRFIRLN